MNPTKIQLSWIQPRFSFHEFNQKGNNFHEFNQDSAFNLSLHNFSCMTTYKIQLSNELYVTVTEVKVWSKRISRPVKQAGMINSGS